MISDYTTDSRVIIIQDNLVKVKDEIVFINADWAPYTFKLNLLLDTINPIKTNFYLIDIDNKICDEFIKENNLIEKCEIGGWDEIFWILNYQVACCLGKDFDEDKMHKYNTLFDASV